MSSFRRLNNLLDGKTSEELAREVAARELGRAEQDQRGRGQAPDRPDAAESPRRRPTVRSADLRPLVRRTSGSATEGIYGLVLALSVIAISWYYGQPDAGRVALSVLVTALVFWLAHATHMSSGETCRRHKG